MPWGINTIVRLETVFLFHHPWSTVRMQEMAIKEAQVASAEETVVTRLIVEVCTHHLYLCIFDIYIYIIKAPLYIYIYIYQRNCHILSILARCQGFPLASTRCRSYSASPGPGKKGGQQLHWLMWNDHIQDLNLVCHIQISNNWRVKELFFWCPEKNDYLHL